MSNGGLLLIVDGVQQIKGQNGNAGHMLQFLM